MIDIREHSICNNSGLSFTEPANQKTNNFFTEIITSISDIKSTHDNNKIIVRDYLNVKVWDI